MRALLFILAGMLAWGAAIPSIPEAQAERLVAYSYHRGDAADLKREFRDLWRDLNDFRHKHSFQAQGFSSRGPYGVWMRRVEDAGRRYPDRLQRQMGLVFAELRQVGLDYERTRGNGSRHTQQKAAAFDRALR